MDLYVCGLVLYRWLVSSLAGCIDNEYIYIYIYIYMCVCVCVCARAHTPLSVGV